MAWTGGPTLGWAVLDWGASFLPSPRDADAPFLLTDEQAEFVLAWYAVDRTGHFLYRRSISERAKGWGKSPLHAFLCLAELGASDPDCSAPVLFDGWRGTEPIGRPWGVKGSPRPWVQIAAVSEDQTDNTYSALFEMLTANDHRAAKALGIDDGRTRLYLRGRPGTLEPVTASAGSREGQPITYALLDETHLYLARNGGRRLAATIRRNVAKLGGRSSETTNAPLLGEGSVAELSGSAAERGVAGILWDVKRPAEEPQPDWSDERMLEALDFVYGDAWWVDRRRILADIRDPATDWSDALRFFFNLRAAGSGKAIDPRIWDERTVVRDVPAGARIGLGFDGSVSDDATILRGCTADGYSFAIGAWVRPKDAPHDWRVPRHEVAERIAWAFSTYDVGRLLADPPKWWSEIEEWAATYGEERVLAFDTNSNRRMAPAVDRWMVAIREGAHTHDGDTITSEHVKAAHREKVRVGDAETDGRTLYKLVKGDDRRKIDAAVADVLAFEAAMTMPAPVAVPVPRFIAAGFTDIDRAAELTPEQEAAELARIAAERQSDYFFGDDL